MDELNADDNAVEIFPNPATTDDLNVQYNSDVPLKITLIDQFGRQVYEEMFNPADQGSKKLELRKSLADGLYFVIIDDGERQFTKRIFIRN
jgi:hypothetical protein